MQHQVPNGMGGPLRGTSVWWHGRGDQADPIPEEPEPAPERSGKHRKKEEEPKMRMELVQRVRREIADGIYDTDAKWEAALDRLLDRVYRD